ncbi:uncharacterized protein [Bombus fervidus]|uniref:uncharacterized protein n=1 Tax=Bombus fervidus TaxID=203811 RepID=UPI003AB569A3
MSLFVINRYEGEKEETKDERNYLSELLKRIEERKVERAIKTNHQIQESSSQNAQESNYKKNKEKAENLNKCSMENINLNENSISSDVNGKAKVHVSELRKNKKKRKYSEGSSNETIKTADKTLQSENTDNQDNEIPNKSSDPNETQEKISGQNSDFIILGVKNKRREREVKRTLPEWLANPEVISIDLNSGPTLDDMNSILDSKLIEALRANGINKLFPVQASMVSWLSKCNKDRQQKWWLRDTCVSAPTGSGTNIQVIYSKLKYLHSSFDTLSLVCSDAIARGIDIPNVQLVISYDLPKHINGYIQRTGRTGHAGKCGTAISILTPKQVKIFKHMLNNAHKVIPRVEKIELSGIINDIDYLSHIDKLKHALEIEKQNLLRAEAIK